MTETVPPTALEVIMEVLPTDPDDGFVFIGIDDDSCPLWGPAEQVAVKIRDALAVAGLLAKTPDEVW